MSTVIAVVGVCGELFHFQMGTTITCVKLLASVRSMCCLSGKE